MRIKVDINLAEGALWSHGVLLVDAIGFADARVSVNQRSVASVTSEDHMVAVAFHPKARPPPNHPPPEEVSLPPNLVRELVSAAADLLLEASSGQGTVEGRITK